MNKVQIAILGRPYTITSNDPPEQIMKCVEILNKRIAKISETIKAASSLDIAIFTALSFVDDLVKQQNGKQIKTDEDDIEKYLSKIINIIDNKLHKN